METSRWRRNAQIPFLGTATTASAPSELEVKDREVEAWISWLGMTAVAGEVEAGDRAAVVIDVGDGNPSHRVHGERWRA